MKHLKFVVLTILYVVSIMLVAQSRNTQVEDIDKWMKSGAYTDVSALMANDVVLTISGTQYTTRQASKAFVGFFDGKIIEEYRLLHSGQNDNSTFIIISMTTKDKEYRMNMLLKDGKIIEIRIE